MSEQESTFLQDHILFVQQIKNQFNDILKNDPVFKDIDSNISLSELRKLVSLEHGESMNLFIRRFDGQYFNVIVKQNATVRDLKQSIKEHFKIKREGDVKSGPAVVNWRYVWRTFCLVYQHQQLVDDAQYLKDFGIKNRAELAFSKIAHKKI